MDQAKAASIVSALADGINPLTGEAFPPDSPYQSAEVIRALYVACRVLETNSARRLRSRTNLPPNAGKPWSEEDDRQLLAEFDSGRPVPELAKTMGRTRAGIQARLERHGRLSSGQGGLRIPSWQRSAAGSGN